MKPYYEHAGITIYHGDCRAILPTLPKVDLVLTSPPYDALRQYGGHAYDWASTLPVIAGAIADGGVIVWIVNDQTIGGTESCTSFRQALAFKDSGLNVWDTMIWHKPDAMPGDGAFRYHQVFEYMFVLSRGTPKARNLLKDVPAQQAGRIDVKNWGRRSDQSLGGKPQKPFIRHEWGARGNVWTASKAGFDRDGALDHPATFPIALASDHVATWSNQGDLVCDPHCGSGTTLRAAKDLGRKAIGIEIEERYCEIAAKRLRQEVLPLQTP